MTKKYYSIEYLDALERLKIYTSVAEPEVAKHPEFSAMVTHWITSANRTAPLVPDELSKQWNQYLIAHLSQQNISLNATNLDNPINIDSGSVIITYNEHRDTESSNYTPFLPPEKSTFKFIDLFAGIGGFCLALQKNNGACVFASEWDKSAKQTYFKNYGKIPYGDIRNFTSKDMTDESIEQHIPDHDILTAGFPCQPFSLAGVSSRNSLNQKHGFACETQGTLFFDIARIARVKRPKFLLLENVSNLVRHNDGHTLETIRSVIEKELGYSFSHAVIDAQTYVPQRRKRCYMVCVRDNEFQFEFPKRFFEGDSQKLESILEPEPDSSYTISKRLWDGHRERSRRNLARGTGFIATIADLEKPSNTLVARYGKDGKECLIEQDGRPPRMLTKREAARLQGYPENFRIADSKTQAYKQFGNSIAVPVVTDLVRELTSHI